MNRASLAVAAMFVPAAAAFVTLPGCGSSPTTPVEKADLTDDSKTSLKNLTRDVPNLQGVLDSSYGYAMFPSVAKGGLGVEGASGRGTVFEQGQPVGYAHLTLVNIGAVIGGENYAELIVFKTKTAMDDFEANKLKFDAHAEAVALKAGAAANAKFNNGVAVFQKTEGGLMVDASIGGQQLTYTADPTLSPTRPAASPTTMPMTGM